MPALIMKAKLRTSSLTEGNGLHVCRNSNKISKNSCSQVRISEQTAEMGSSIQCFQDVPTNIKESAQEIGGDETINHQEFSDRENLQFQRQSSSLVDSEPPGKMGISPATCPANLETIFSPILESSELHYEPSLYNYAVGNYDDLDVPRLTADDSDDGSSSSCDYQSWNASDFYISDISIANIPFEGNTGSDDIMELHPSPEFDFVEPSMMRDLDERYMILPKYEEATELSNTHSAESCVETLMNSTDSCLYLAIHQMKSSNQEVDANPHFIDSDETDYFDPHLFIRNFPDLADMVPSLRPKLLPKETRKKPITLVLDLDETLVHSTLEHSDNADFTFQVYFNMKEHTVYVQQRPYLLTFLERVAEMFEVIVFTASQSTYAEQLLNILDPDGKLISRRAYRESCIFSDGSYTKDLTVLGVDLAKVAIIDNSPQVFRLQVNNGIPIKSWFDDPSDRALISLLPFLETLVDADDVRPIIAERFGNKE